MSLTVCKGKSTTMCKENEKHLFYCNFYGVSFITIIIFAYATKILEVFKMDEFCVTEAKWLPV